MAIVRRIPWTKQPPAGKKIAFGNPITRDLIFCPEFDKTPFVRDIVSGVVAPNIFGTPTRINSPLGVGGEFNIAGPDDMIWVGHAKFLETATSPFSIVVLGHWLGGTGDFQTVVGFDDIEFHIPSSETDTFLAVDVFDQASSNASGLTVVAGEDHVFAVGCAGSGTTPDFFKDGEKEAGSISITYDITLTNAILLGDAQGGNNCDFVIYFAGLWNRKLTDAEQISLAQNPWQIFEPRRVIVPVQVAAAGTSGLIKRKIPWTRQPPYPVRSFDRANPFGRHCIFALIPGWGNADQNTGKVVSVGQRLEFDAVDVGSAGGTLTTLSRAYGHGIGSAKVIEFDQQSGVSGHALLRTDNDHGIEFPDPRSLTIVAIFKPIGDGRPGGTGDPRIFSQDLGDAADDHDLMLSVGNAGNAVRMRVRLGSATQTVVSSSALQDDALNLVAGSIEPQDGTNVTAICTHIREDGVSSRVSGSNNSNSYNPRNATDIGIGSLSVLDQNFEGDIICICAFNRAFDTVDAMRALFYNPWQIFEPRTVLIPVVVAGAAPSPTNPLYRRRHIGFLHG